MEQEKRQLDQYGYTGKFCPEETGFNEYRPSVPRQSYYVNIYPSVYDDEAERFKYGDSFIRARIIPESMYTLKVSGYPGIFSIYPFDNTFAEIDNRSRHKTDRYRMLISLEDLEKSNLEIKEGTKNPNY